MDKGKWMTFINHLWVTIGYWHLLNAYKQNALQEVFFDLTGLAVRNEFLMRIAHTVHLCQEIDKEFDVGPDAQNTLKEVVQLYEKGDSLDRRVMTFKDCGIKPFQDKVLAHPLDHIKELLGKPPYHISVKWETMEETLEKIKQFCDLVERHHAGSWDLTSYKDEVRAVDVAFQKVMWGLKEGAKYEMLKQEVGLRGEKVHWDPQKDEIVIDE